MTQLLFEAALKSTALLAVASLVTRALRSQSPALRHRIWALALTGSLLLPVLSALSTFQLAPAAETTVRQVTAVPRFNEPSTGAMVINATLAVAQKASATDWLTSLWLTGTALSLASLTIGAVRLRQLKSTSRPSESPNIHLAATECMPMTWGALRPLVLLPASAATWTPDRTRAVLAHESAHIARNDWAIQIIGELTRALYWFHPLVWFACNRMRQESEEACDNAVLNSGIPAAEYAGHLLDLARALPSSKAVWSTALAMARPSHLERRFTAMLTTKSNRAGLTKFTATLTAFLAAAALLPLAGIHAQTTAGPLTGIVLDPAGAPLRNATVIVTTPAGIVMTATGNDGAFELLSPGAGNATMQVRRPGSVTANTSLQLQPGLPFRQNITLQPGTPEDPAPAAGQLPQRIRVGGNVQSMKFIHRPNPVYPPEAKAARIQGTVLMDAVISVGGTVTSLRVTNLDIDPSLARSAVETVSRWTYQPTLLNGNPVEVLTVVQINYTLLP